MVVFRPHKGEVITARIVDQSPEGINREFPLPNLVLHTTVLTTSVVATDFFDDIFVPWTELPEVSEL